MSPSMDILISSNLERLLFMLSGHDDAMVKELMKKLSEEGSYTIPDELLQRIQETFCAYWTSEEECAQTIHALYQEEQEVIDPHTAVALHAARTYQKETGSEEPVIVLSTASPYKFSRDVLRCLNGEELTDDFKAMDRLHALSGLPVPQGLAELRDLPVRFTRSIEQKDGMHVIAERMKEIANVQD
jgi:threonine synthase